MSQRTTMLEIRALDVADDGSATIEGLAVPYGRSIDLGGITETIAVGAVDTRALVGKPILWQHDQSEPIGRITAASNSDDGAHIRARILPTAARGRDAIMLLRESVVSGLSIGFRSTDDEWDGTHVTRRSVDVAEVSVATIPAYPDAEITAVRNQEGTETMESPAVPATAPAVDLTGLATRDDLTALESRMAALTTPTDPAPVLDVRSALVHQLTASRDARQMRALADTVSGGNAGLLPPDWSSEVRDYVDRQRYAFNACGSIGFPTSGFTLTIPKVLQHTTVGPRGAEKSEIPSQAFTTGSDTYTAEWYAGGADVSLEVIWQSDPAIYPLVVDSILSQYAVVTDDALTKDVEAAGTATTAALDFTDWGTVSAQIIATAEDIRAATGEWGDRLMLTTASWQSLIGLTDADGRRIFAPGGATNSDGSARLLSRSVNVGGVFAFHNPRSLEDVQFNAKSARVMEKPPVMLQSDNVALMGRDLGVLGAFAFIPAYPGGIYTHSAA
jgi:HK97 family phage prohead protease